MADTTACVRANGKLDADWLTVTNQKRCQRHTSVTYVKNSPALLSLLGRVEGERRHEKWAVLVSARRARKEKTRPALELRDPRIAPVSILRDLWRKTAILSRNRALEASLSL